MEMKPAIEQVLVRRLRALDPVEDLHRHRRHHIESTHFFINNLPLVQS